MSDNRHACEESGYSVEIAMEKLGEINVPWERAVEKYGEIRIYCVFLSEKLTSWTKRILLGGPMGA